MGQSPAHATRIRQALASMLILQAGHRNSPSQVTCTITILTTGACRGHLPAPVPAAARSVCPVPVARCPGKGRWLRAGPETNGVCHERDKEGEVISFIGPTSIGERENP
ncbi:unnamed protein product [Caretta caretta]